VTALDQSITASDESSGTSEQLSGLIETNAGIEPGDSGGPLVNSYGQIVGMDTAAMTGYEFGGTGNGGYGSGGSGGTGTGGTGGSTGASGNASATQGYAIPIDTALSVAKEIEAGQGSSVIHIGPTAFIGIGIAPSTGQATSGVAIAGAQAGTPAAKIGLVEGDVITAINGKAMTTGTQISETLIQQHPGDKITLTWTNTSGQSQTATLTLGTGPAA
jgi:S1-C subfamily serine protease